MEKVKLIIFDLDGTIIDSLQGLINSVRRVFNLFGYTEISEEFVKSCLGGGAKNLIKRALGEEHKEVYNEVYDAFINDYHQNAVLDTHVYDGVTNTLKYFYGKKKLAIATYKDKIGTDSILKHLKLYNYFDMILTVDDVKKAKPNPECINQILKGLNVETEHTILIGDTTTDVLTGKNANVRTCAVTYGYGEILDIKKLKPDYIIDNIEELKVIVEGGMANGK